MNDFGIKFVVNEEKVGVPQQKNQNENQNLLEPEAHVHVGNTSLSSKAMFQKKEKKSNLRQRYSLRGEVSQDYPEHFTFPDVFEREKVLDILAFIDKNCQWQSLLYHLRHCTGVAIVLQATVVFKMPSSEHTFKLCYIIFILQAIPLMMNRIRYIKYGLEMCTLMLLLQMHSVMKRKKILMKT